MAEDPLKEDDSTTANYLYFDSAIRHQIGIRRFTAGEVKRLTEMIQESDRDFIKIIRGELADLIGKNVSFQSKAFKQLIDLIKEKRAVTMDRFRRMVRKTLSELAKSEVDFEFRMIESALPVDIPVKKVSQETASAVIGSAVIAIAVNQGRTMEQWLDIFQDSDQQKIVEAIQLGYSQGQSVNDIARRIAGTKANNFTDGILSINRRNAEAIVRTSINSISNQAREKVWEANSDIIKALRWTSVLDGRTSAICRSRDGMYVALRGTLPKGFPKLEPPDARPPAHVNCRSVMVAVFDDVSIAQQMGDRPFVRDARTRRKREMDFRREAREQGVSVQEIRSQWAQENIGRIPATTTYNEWLKRQPAEFQAEVLGKTKSELFRRGKISLDQFTDRSGNELTLAQLKKTRPEVFNLN